MNFKVNLQKNNICTHFGGKNISPVLSWNNIQNTKSYALILEDPDTPNGTFIHWYIPYISPNITTINILNNNNTLIKIPELKNIDIIHKINIFQGYNSLNNIGYYGPCNPFNNVHHYIFHLYSLDNIIPNLTSHLKIISSDDFENILLKNNINIIKKSTITYLYSHNSNIKLN